MVLPLPFLLLLAATPPAPGPGGPAQAITDSETVFAELRPTGALDRVIVVDWLRVIGSDRVHVEDASPGRDVKALAGTPRPRTEGDNLAWDIEVDGARDLFITATPTQKLPVDVSMRYLVDGSEVPAERAQGIKGKVRVEGRVKNLTQPFIPLVANVTFSLPISSFTSLDQGEATAVSVGRSVRLSYLLVPRSEATFTFMMDTKRSRLPSISMTVLPQIQQGPDILKALNDLRSALVGLQSLSGLGSGAAGLASGSSGVLSAAGDLGKLLGSVQVPQAPQIPRLPAPEKVAQALGASEGFRRANQLARALGIPGPETLRSLGNKAGRDLGRAVGLPQIPSIAGLTAPLQQLAGGLADLQATAARLQAVLGGINAGGLGNAISELTKAGEQFGTPEEGERAKRFDTFTGKPAGAEGEVRFVYRVAAPAEPESPPPSRPSNTKQRSFWSRLVSLVPGVK
jgi:putative membrane protein